MRSHARGHRGGKRGECLSEQESQLRRVSVCMCERACEIEGAGEERGDALADADTQAAATCTAADHILS